MSVVSGTIGAVMGSDATESAANTAAAASREAAATQKAIYEQQRADFKPYMEAGYGGLEQIKGYDLMKGVGEAPSYEKEYTQKLADYAQSPAYKAQETLNQQALQRQLNARGLNYGATGASAGAELSQKLIASDYDKYRQDLAARYTALKGEFAQKRDINQNQYNQLLDLVKIGQGAASSAGQAGNVYAQQAGQAGQNLANIYSQQGAQQAGLWSGLGGASASTVGTGLRAYELGQKAGWWGGGAGGTTLGSTVPQATGIGLSSGIPTNLGVNTSLQIDPAFIVGA